MDDDLWRRWEAGLAHQKESEPGEADTSGGKQRRLHGRVLAHFSGTAGELTEPLLQEEKQTGHG